MRLVDPAENPPDALAGLMPATAILDDRGHRADRTEIARSARWDTAGGIPARGHGDQMQAGRKRRRVA